MNDLTAVAYTGNNLPESFAQKMRDNLLEVTKGIPLICVSQKPMEGFGENISVGDIGRSHFNIYRQALIGAEAATTPFIALVEDDVIYPQEHFSQRPTPGVFAYNKSIWNLYTWSNPPMFSHKDRRNLYALICERELFIEAMNERFAKYPNDQVDKKLWGEPGRYENHLKVQVRESEVFFTEIPLIAFSHPTALSFGGLGKRKKLGNLKAFEIPHYGRAEDMVKLYA